MTRPVWLGILLAMGAAVVTGRRTTPIAVGLLGLYGVVATVIAVVLARLAG